EIAAEAHVADEADFQVAVGKRVAGLDAAAGCELDGDGGALLLHGPSAQPSGRGEGEQRPDPGEAEATAAPPPVDDLSAGGRFGARAGGFWLGARRRGIGVFCAIT